jgi:dTDP-4-amino-4,6-dideoxygalactose transaminase
MTRVPLLDLVGLYQRHRAEVDAAIARVLASQQFILGPEVEAFEAELGTYLGGGLHAVGVSNGTDALRLALMALGVGPGDEVVVPAYTFVATASAVSLTGARPVFVDVRDDTLNMDTTQLADRLSERSRAVIPVHLFGLAADLDALAAVLAGAGYADLPVVEDAAQALGGRLGGRALGTIGRLGCYSFFPSKNLGAFGDAGTVVTADAGLAEQLRLLRNQGRRRPYHHEVIALNARLDALQAAVLRARLPHVDDWVAERRRHAQRYREAFDERGLLDRLRPPAHDPGGRALHGYNQFNVRVLGGRRDELQRFLAERGVGTAVYYPEPLPTQPCFADLGYRPGQFPVSEAAARESLALPVYPGLTADQQEYVIEMIGAFWA